MTAAPSVEEVVQRASSRAFGRALITNVLRGQLVEAIVAIAIEPEWNWCSQDFASWDFDRADGLRLEVKQSAARQTWLGPEHSRTSCQFDIRSRTEGGRALSLSKSRGVQHSFTSSLTIR
jgi:hypothetical protein